MISARPREGGGSEIQKVFLCFLDSRLSGNERKKMHYAPRLACHFSPDLVVPAIVVPLTVPV